MDLDTTRIPRLKMRAISAHRAPRWSDFNTIRKSALATALRQSLPAPSTRTFTLTTPRSSAYPTKAFTFLDTNNQVVNHTWDAVMKEKAALGILLSLRSSAIRTIRKRLFKVRKAAVGIPGYAKMKAAYSGEFLNLF